MRALAAAEHVGAHDEVAVGVERLARADQAVPPTGGLVSLDQWPRRVAVARQRMAHEHRVAAVGIERTPCLVGDADVAERAAALEHERAIGRERQEPPFAGRVAGPPRPGRRQHRRMDPAAHTTMMPCTLVRTSAQYPPFRRGRRLTHHANTSSDVPYAWLIARPASSTQPASSAAAPAFHAVSSIGSGTSSTCFADSLIASGCNAAPAWRRSRPRADARRAQRRRDAPQFG